MNKMIQLSIAGRGPNTDAPTVDDLLDQVRDYFALFETLEKSMMEDGASAIEWRITNASKNSPLSLTAEAFSRQYAVNIDERAALIMSTQFNGLVQLQTSPARPDHFTDKALSTAERIFDRVTNGLDQTVVNLGEDNIMKLLPAVARRGVQNIQTVLAPIGRPYREIGSLEGRFITVQRDGFGRPIIYIRDRVTGNDIKCIVGKEAMEEVKYLQINDVWRGRRVRVFGTLHNKSIGKISQIEISDIRFLRDSIDLPSLDDIVDPNFTDGMKTEDYLNKVRDSGLS